MFNVLYEIKRGTQVEKNSRVKHCADLGSAGTGDLKGRGALGWRNLEFSILKLWPGTGG